LQKQQAWYFTRLSQSLDILVEFFHASGKGLQAHVMNTERMQAVHTALHLFKAPTDDVIEFFYKQKLQEQVSHSGT
jgi:hypothetical protein